MRWLCRSVYDTVQNAGELFLCTLDPAIPVDNHQAERGIRPVVVTSGGQPVAAGQRDANDADQSAADVDGPGPQSLGGSPSPVSKSFTPTLNNYWQPAT